MERPIDSGHMYGFPAAKGDSDTPLSLLKEIARIKRYAKLNGWKGGKSGTKTTLNMPDELLDRIDALLAGDK